MIGGSWMRMAKRIGRAQAAAMVERMAAKVGEIPGVRIERRDEQLVLRGRGLLRRRLSDPLLRFWAGWAR